MIPMHPRPIAHLRRSKERPKLDKEALTIENMPFQLQVTTQMKREALPAFHKSNTRLIELIKMAGLELELSCWKMEGEIVQFYNYWNLSCDTNRLAVAELILPDVPTYAQFAKLWINETKDIVVPINAVRVPPQLDPSEQYVYLRVSYEVPFVALSEFAARVEGSLRPFAKYHGWFLGDIYWGMTGRAGTVVELWIVPEDDAAFAPHRLATLPWHALLAGVPTYQVLEPTPSDPQLGALYWDSRVDRLARRNGGAKRAAPAAVAPLAAAPAARTSSKATTKAKAKAKAKVKTPLAAAK